MRWVCPNCDVEGASGNTRPAYHPCAGLSGLAAPMVPADSGARVFTREREDYIGSERVFLHEGRPVMSLVTERPDGSSDVVVFAPTAVARVRE